MYFRLNPECFFIDGKSRGAIYDLVEGNIFSLTPEETSIVRNCEKDLIADKSNSFLSDLEKQCLGTFYENRVFIEKLRIGSPIEEYQPGRPPKLTRAFLEINNSCERKCWYCGYNGIHRSMGCMGCNKWDESGEEIGQDRWMKLIDELEDLECQMIYFTGGDLTKVWENTLTLIDYAQGRFKNIFISLTHDSLSGKIKNDITHKATPIVQTEKPEEVHNEYPCLLTLSHDIPDEKMNDMPQNGAIEIVAEDFHELSSKSPILSKRKIPGTNVHSFYHNKKTHPCLGNSLSISWRGDVLPCLLMRNHVLGNIRNAGLFTVFQKNLKGIHEFWNISLDSIEKCGSCEFKFACNDCRALEESLTGKLLGKVLCNYDQATGHWL